jgi:molybdate transport system regulatory protein
MEIRYKIWLEKDGEAVFGNGLESLLETIDEAGSINRASAALHMSYREAWGRIKEAEDRLGFKLLERQIGGEEGGGAKLTDRARDLLKRYEDLRAEVDREMERIYRNHFGDPSI